MLHKYCFVLTILMIPTPEELYFMQSRFLPVLIIFHCVIYTIRIIAVRFVSVPVVVAIFVDILVTVIIRIM